MFVYLNRIITPYYYHYICPYISYDAFIQQIYFRSRSKNVLTHTFLFKNVLTHTFLFENWPYTYIFIFMLYIFNSTNRPVDNTIL